MAIDRTQFNLLVDDDGSNTIGSPWNKAAIAGVVLDPVDAAIATWGNWTPTDGSGSGLVFSTKLGRYMKQGKLVKIWVHVVYPANTDAAAALIGSLPFPNNSTFYLGFYQTYGPPAQLHLPINQTLIYVLTPGTGASMTNAQVSGQQIIFQGDYFTD